MADGADQPCDVVVDGVDGAGLRHAQPMLDLGKDLLDRIEVRRVRRQERELGAGGEDRIADRLRTMAAEIVENDDVAGAKHWHQELLDIGPEDDPVDRAIDHARCGKGTVVGAISYCSAIALQLSPDAIAAATRSLRSFEYGLAMHAGALSQHAA